MSVFQVVAPRIASSQLSRSSTTLARLCCVSAGSTRPRRRWTCRRVAKSRTQNCEMVVARTPARRGHAHYLSAGVALSSGHRAPYAEHGKVSRRWLLPESVWVCTRELLVAAQLAACEAGGGFLAGSALPNRRPLLIAGREAAAVRQSCATSAGARQERMET